MANSRSLIILVLLCWALATLIATQPIRGQTVATSTLQQYNTTGSVITVYSTSRVNSTIISLVHYDQTPYYYNNETNSFVLGQMVAAPYSNGNRGDFPCLYYDYFLLNTTITPEIRVHFSTVTGPIHFFILASHQLKAFIHSNCGYNNWSWNVHVFASSYELVWVAPQGSEYALLFVSRGFYGGPIQIEAQVYRTIIHNLTETYTTSLAYAFQSSQIIASTLLSSNPQPSPTNYYIPIVIVGIFVLAVGLLKLRRHRAQ